MNVQRLLKFPKTAIIKTRSMVVKERVNHNRRQRGYEARDKEEIKLF